MFFCTKYHDDSFVRFYEQKLRCIRDRPFNLKGVVVMDFCFVHKKIFGQYKSQNNFFFVAQCAKFLFQNLTLGYMTKNSESDFFSLHQNQNIFFSNIGNPNIFF